MSQPAFAVSGLEVAYPGGVHALGPIDLASRAGEITALVGPSGCGKSTLLGVLAGLTGPSAGVVQAAPERPGVVFQDPTLMPWARIIDNVALPLVLAGEDRAPARAAAQTALEAVGLGAFSHARPSALSGGMRMRAALARALVGKPDALLLDEPFAAIDEIGRRALDDLVLALRAERGLAVLFVTHSVDEAAYLADRIVVLSPRPGRTVADIAVSRAGIGEAHLSSDGFRDAARAARAALRGPAP